MKISPPCKTWLVFDHEDSLTSRFLVQRIRMMTNRAVILVKRGAEFEKANNGSEQEFTIRPDSKEDFNQLISSVEKDGNVVIEGILYCWSLSQEHTRQENIIKPFFYLTQKLLRHHHKPGLKLIVLTRGIASVEDNDLSHVYPSTMWGFMKSLQNERTDFICRCVDIGGSEAKKRSYSDMMQVFYELWMPGNEPQVAYHGANRYVPKLVPVQPSQNDLKLPVGVDKFQLILPDSRSIMDLKFGPLQDPLILEDGQVEVQVKCSALNLRDVLSVLKPTDQFNDVNAVGVGFDFAGEVKRVHPTVTKWRVGDNVFGVSVNGAPLPSHVRIHEKDLLAVPDYMSLREACTLPTVVIARYCVIDVAKIQPGDTVLIHSASVGAGPSAIELCQHIGATIIATAGSKRKQNYLRTLGVQHVFPSRNTEYSDKILEVTNGRGVNVVLNSLTNEGFIEATLKACALGARFVEMNKLSVWQPEEVEKYRPDVAYTKVDVSSIEGTEWRRLLNSLVKLTEDKVVSPIPYVQFGGLNIREALQCMQKGKYIGKVVCIMPEVTQIAGRTQVHIPMFHARGTYLITGGLGGIGFEVCKWMTQMGAKYVLLAGRNSPNSEMQNKIDNLNAKHQAKIRAVQLNVSSFDQCKELLQCKIPEMGYPALKGAMHAAGTLRDNLIENHTWETLSSTFGTKIDGTLNLHQLTTSMQLEHFVLFSSISALFGSHGQSNYSVGNTFKDKFAHYRNSIGLPATSINWGQWGEVGVATETNFPGIKPMANLHGIAGLEYSLKSQRTQIGVFNVESFVMLSNLCQNVSSYLDERVWKSSVSSSSAPLKLNSNEFWQKYESSSNHLGKLELVKNSLQTILRSTLNLDKTDAIGDNGNFQEMGVDSLTLVEIKNAVQSLFGDRLTVNTSVLRDCNTIKVLGKKLVQLIEGTYIKTDQSPASEN